MNKFYNFIYIKSNSAIPNFLVKFRAYAYFYACDLNRYVDLKNNRLANYTFDFDQALNKEVCIHSASPLQ